MSDKPHTHTFVYIYILLLLNYCSLTDSFNTNRESTIDPKVLDLLNTRERGRLEQAKLRLKRDKAERKHLRYMSIADPSQLRTEGPIHRPPAEFHYPHPQYSQQSSPHPEQGSLVGQDTKRNSPLKVDVGSPDEDTGKRFDWSSSLSDRNSRRTVRNAENAHKIVQHP